MFQKFRNEREIDKLIRQSYLEAKKERLQTRPDLNFKFKARRITSQGK